MNNGKFHIKQIAFPREHGSWGFVIEPLALTLLIAYSFHGLLIAVSAFFIFLSHQPIKIFFSGSKITLQKKWTVIIALVYFAIAFATIVDVLLTDTFLILVPYIIAVCLMSIYLLLELKGFKRNLISELIAPVAISILVLSIALAANWNFQSIFAFWVLLLSRTVTTTFYIHEKLNMLKKKSGTIFLPYFSNTVFLFLLIYFVYDELLPILSLAAFGILFIRSIWGLRKWAKKLSVKQIGMLEFLYGFLFVIISACGFIIGV